MAAGRPPKLFTGEECEELGKDILNWVQENPKATYWVPWYLSKGMLHDDWEALANRPEFIRYYLTARRILASNIALRKDLAPSYGNRYLALYDPDLRAHEKEIKDEDAKRTKDVISVADPAKVANLNVFFEAQRLRLRDLRKIEAENKREESHTDLEVDPSHD